MADIPLPWRAYAALQSDLNNRRSVDATAWGMEEGLNYLLQSSNLSADADRVEGVVANAARRDRYGRSLLAKHIIISTEIDATARRLEARSSLASLQRQMPSDKFGLLLALATGTEPAHLAANQRVDAGALRTRIARARRAARDIAA
jgi:hypothetical protein